MNDDQLLRYSRHIFVDEIGIIGQEKILKARVLIIGAGGLGCPAALYLASAGVGFISIADGDTVELSNLQRQILYSNKDINSSKALSAQHALSNINPDVCITTIDQRLENEQLSALIAATDIVLDCTDNFATRHAINRACVEHKVPLVSGAAIGFQGQISVFDQRQASAPCYACLFPPDQTYEETQCSSMGVFAPLTGIIGAMQAAQALQLIVQNNAPLANRLLSLDAKTMQWHDYHIQRNPYCTVCVDKIPT